MRDVFSRERDRFTRLHSARSLPADVGSSKLRRRRGSNHRNIERILKNKALDDATTSRRGSRRREGLYFSKEQLSYFAARVVAPPFSSDVLANPFRAKRRQRWQPAFPVYIPHPLEEKLSKRIPLEV